MQYREQESLAPASPVFGTMASLVQRCDLPKERISRHFRTVDACAKFMQAQPDEAEATGKFTAYGRDARDVRYVVTGRIKAPAKARVRLKPARVIMTAGITLDRLLPVCLQADFGNV